MNNRFEFDHEAFGDQPSSFEGEQEIKRRGAGRAPQRKPAAGRKTGAARKADSGRKPAAKPRPRPGKKFPIRLPVAALPYPVWPVLAPEPAKEPRGQEPRQDSAPSGSPPPPPERDQAREGSEFTRWAQITLNKALNLNLQTNGVIDDATRNAIRSFQQREGKGTIKESDPRLRPVIEGYWQNGPGYKPSEPNWWSAVPWSAAFISWLMRKAGAGADFKYSGSHADYTAAAKQNRLANNNNPFKAYRITEAKPRVGDLVCKSRAGSGATYDNIASGRSTVTSRNHLPSLRRTRSHSPFARLNRSR